MENRLQNDLSSHSSHFPLLPLPFSLLHSCKLEATFELRSIIGQGVSFHISSLQVVTARRELPELPSPRSPSSSSTAATLTCPGCVSCAASAAAHACCHCQRKSVLILILLMRSSRCCMPLLLLLLLRGMQLACLLSLLCSVPCCLLCLLLLLNTNPLSLLCQQRMMIMRLKCRNQCTQMAKLHAQQGCGEAE